MKTIWRISNGVAFIISLPLLLLAYLYASETTFWSDGPATDYPLLHTPRPDMGIRLHGLLCLLSASGMTGVTWSGIRKEKRHVPPSRLFLEMGVYTSCLISIWWNPWTVGPMQHEEMLITLLVSSLFLYLLSLTIIYFTKKPAIQRIDKPITTA
jgi:hypothetical protein